MMDPGRVLVSAGTASTGTVYKAGDKGGEEAHSLTEDENAPHTHDASCSKAGLHKHTFPLLKGSGSDHVGGVSNSYTTDPHGTGETSEAGLHDHEITVGVSGKGTPHNNMQPYQVIYRWVRVA